MHFLCLLSAFLASLILNGLGIEVVREDVFIVPLGSETGYRIIPECSGVNSITALAVCALFHGVLNIKKPLRIVFFVACSVPVALGANILRLVVVVLVAHHFGAPASEVCHFLSGFVTFPIAIAIMFVIASKLSPYI